VLDNSDEDCAGPDIRTPGRNDHCQPNPNELLERILNTVNRKTERNCNPAATHTSFRIRTMAPKMRRADADGLHRVGAEFPFLLDDLPGQIG